MVDFAIETAVELMRKQLGLRTWTEQTEWAREQGFGERRRTGRTTHGLLRAIAVCERDGATMIAIQAEPRANLDYCIATARDLLQRLGLTHIRVVRDRMGVTMGRMTAVSYVDHHHPRIAGS